MSAFEMMTLEAAFENWFRAVTETVDATLMRQARNDFFRLRDFGPHDSRSLISKPPAQTARAVACEDDSQSSVTEPVVATDPAMVRGKRKRITVTAWCCGSQTRRWRFPEADFPPAPAHERCFKCGQELIFKTAQEHLEPNDETREEKWGPGL